MSLKRIFFKNKITYKIYLYYNLYIRHKGFLKRKRYSQWGEDQFIDQFFKDKEKGIYIDIGCFNPFMYSNTCLLYKRGWSGINIDINPTSIDLFNIVRPNDINLCTTINEKKKIFDIYYDDPFSPVNTLDKSFYKRLGKKKIDDNKNFTVSSKTIDEIIKISKKEKINFINIDVEGMDYNILTKIKIEELRPNLIAIETHKVDGMESKDYFEIKNLLEKKKFTIFRRVGPTTLFKLI